MAKTWPEDEYEDAAYADWKYQVQKEETVRGFRDWLKYGNAEED